MKGSQLRRLQKLEKQIGEDRQDFTFRDIELIYKECPDIVAAKDELQDYIIRHGADPPRFYKYDEEEGTRRWIWTIGRDKRAGAMFRRLHVMVQQEAERRGVEREKEAKERLIKGWEWYLGKPEREAKEAAEREERKRRMEEERLERERRWEEERAARLQQANQQQPYGGPTNGWLRDG